MRCLKLNIKQLTMKKELLALLDYWEQEKGVDRASFLESLEKALLTVYRKKVNLPEDVQVKIDSQTGEMKFIDGEGKEVTPPTFPWERIAAQSAKQIFIQKIREAEKNAVYQEFTRYQNTIISGRVERFEDNHLIISFGKTEGILPQHHRLSADHFRVGDNVLAYLLEVRKPHQGNYQLVLSRTHQEFVRNLLINEIPELKEGLIEIKALARFPGDLTKVAVYSTNEKIDPVGTCIGDKALRIKNITKELHGEKIEVLRWEEDPAQFIVNSLGPARAEKVILNADKKEAVVLVSDEQLYLAIGKRGQNVRLACKLTGWNIRVFRPSEYTAAQKPALCIIEGIDENLARELGQFGFDSIKSLAQATMEDLMKIPGMDEEKAVQIMARAAGHLQENEAPQ